MPKIAIVAALHRELAGLLKNSRRVDRDYSGRKFTFYDSDDKIIICGGIGLEAARRAAEAVIALYHPAQLHSVGFAGALTETLKVGDIFRPAIVLDARDASRTQIDGGEGTLITFQTVASAQQKKNLAQAYGAQAVDMEAAAVAAAARAHNIPFTATKVISDGLHFEMPDMDRFINTQGQFKTAPFALYAALRPWLWTRVATLASNSSKASKSLSNHLKLRSYSATNVVEAKTT
jgi:adenosylhomocysteine nucleosidase